MNQMLDVFGMKRAMVAGRFRAQAGDPQGRLRRGVAPGDRERRHQRCDHAVVVIQRRLMIRARCVGVMKCGVLVGDGLVVALSVLDLVHVARWGNRT